MSVSTGHPRPLIVMPYPVRSEATLPGSRVGAVAATDADRPHEPLVRIDGSDLRVRRRDATAV
jgi:hypothetical protein